LIANIVKQRENVIGSCAEIRKSVKIHANIEGNLYVQVLEENPFKQISSYLKKIPLHQKNEFSAFLNEYCPNLRIIFCNKAAHDYSETLL